jgi:predicted helicase
LVSNVNEIVHRHLRIADDAIDAKDPIIHFYEDFLKEYDPAQRKKMGAYYTPVPVVQFIVRQVDRILKEDFGITSGLASDEMIDYEIETGQDLRLDRRTKANTKQTLHLPRVQILDPAVGTATFLNEIIKHIHKSFIGQEGRWTSYVNENLLKRLYGFELMMAPYTIAHLKLGMTLQETGVEELNQRLSIFLTNTLEEGIPQQPSLFDFGLAAAVSEESRLAAEVKSERPVTVVMGNPPYSGESSNKTRYANSLIDKYRKEPGGQHKLKEQTSKWLGDDYVKFIAFAEDMIAKNGAGIFAMITNNGYLDNPTFRGMRWHLAQTFDKIYLLDLHGNAKKKETAPDGGKDENVFDIMQGVSIILAVKTAESKPEPASVYHAEIYGTRAAKFHHLNQVPNWAKIDIQNPFVRFKPVDNNLQEEYHQGISVAELFKVNGAGITTAHDDFVIDPDPDQLIERFTKFRESTPSEDLYKKFNVRRKTGWDINEGWHNLNSASRSLNDYIKPVAYRIFDDRHIFYEDKLVWRTVNKVMRHFNGGDNLGIAFARSQKSNLFDAVYIVDKMMETKCAEASTQSYVAPLYLYAADGSRQTNFSPTELAKLTRYLSNQPSPEEILEYAYAALHSPRYRQKFKDFLKIDFPRIPVPKNDEEFKRLVRYGHQLCELHLMKSSLLSSYGTTYPEAGSDLVESVKYNDSKVWINDSQYFGNVPELAWEFQIGGYQPAQKWLKDRKGRTLSNQDLDHYQKIIKTLLETHRLMQEIDNTIATL